MSHSPKWYFTYSIFSLFIIVGVFAIMNSYAESINSQFSVITFDTVEELANPDVAYSAAPSLQSLVGYGLLVFFGIAGFLFTKYVYEKQVMHSV